MFNVTFDAYVSYGKMDAVNYDVDITLTDDEYNRLKESAKEYDRPIDDPSILDIYEKLYSAALEWDVSCLKGNREELANGMSWYLDIEYDEALEREYTDEEIAEMLEEQGCRGLSYPYGMRDADEW